MRPERDAVVITSGHGPTVRAVQDEPGTTAGAGEGDADSAEPLREDARATAFAAMHNRPALPGDDGQMGEVLLAQLFPRQVARPRLGRYVLLGFLGEGGMGSVYAAYDERLDRRVAVKFIRAAFADAQAQARLLREAMAMARLSHPNIVAVHDVGEEADGRVHIAMEYVQGEDLATWQREPRPWREVVAAYRQAGEGLAAAHAADLVHRDFKPQNVIRREDGVVKVLDFGLAWIGAARDDLPPSLAADRGAIGSLTRTGAIMGTPVYMAPEQHEGARADARSDQFSFCVALWEGLFGQPPFPIDSLAALHHAMSAGQRVEPSDTRGVPGWIRRVLDRGLMVAPAARYPSMRALLRDLERDPAARRRRVAAALTVVALTIGGGLGIAELRLPQACIADAQATEALWGADRREQLRAGLLRADAPDETWSLLQPHLDAYAAALADARRDACETHRRALESDALYDRRVACLDRRRAGFVQLTELVAAGDQNATLHILSAAAALPPLSSCADTEALSAELPPPGDPVAAARVAGLREELARAHTEETAGKHAEAEARAAAVQQEAEALGYAPLLAEAALRWGSAAMQRGKPEALARLDLALWTALRAEHRGVAAEAAAKRIFARLVLDEPTADVSERIALAESLVERAGAGDVQLRWLLANNTAIAWEHCGELTRALAAYKEALALVSGTASFERAATLQNMAPLQVQLGERDAGEQAARSAVAELGHLLGRDHPHTASAEAVFAVVLGTLGHHAEAAETLAGAIERASADSSPPPLSMLREAARIALQRRDLAGVYAWSERAAPQLVSADGTPSAWQLAFAALTARAAALAGDLRALERLDAVDAGIRAGAPAFVANERTHILLALGRPAEVEALARAQLAGGTSETFDHETRLLLARALVAQGAHAEATELLTALLAEGTRARLGPGDRALALQALAAAESASGLHPSAIARAREALRVLDGFDDPSPPLADAWFTLARTLAAADPADPTDRREPHALARRALDLYMSLGTGGAADADRVRRWLSARE